MAFDSTEMNNLAQKSSAIARIKFLPIVSRPGAQRK